MAAPRFLPRLFAAALVLLSLVARADTPLPAAHDLRADAAAAARRGEPLILMFSLPGCAYCESLRRSTYQWLVRDGHVVRQVEMVDSDALRGFDGRPTTGAAVAAAYGVRLAPTVLFVGPGGRELADRLVGAGVPEMYGGLVDRALSDGARRLAGHDPS